MKCLKDGGCFSGEISNDQMGGNETAAKDSTDKVKFEIYGEEMVEKIIKLSDKRGRIYLPCSWVGSRVKIIKL